MKKKILFLLTFLMSFNYFFGQVCGTPQPENTELSYKNSSITINNKINNNLAYCIDINFKVIRETNGTTAFNFNTPEEIIDELNSFYSSHNIYFNNVGLSYIDNSAFVNIGGEIEAAQLANTNNDSNSINYYIVETLWNTANGFVTGTAIDIPSNNLVIRNDRTLTSTSAHEIGHCLDLYHTFETYFGTEAIDGSNCEIAGDKVCDTPADSNNGVTGGYNPDLTNAMSYYLNRDHFTTGQADRMKNSIENESTLQQVVGSECIYIDGSNSVCTGDNIVYELVNLPTGASITWNYPASIMYIVSGQGTAVCTFNPFTSSSSVIISATVSYNGDIFLYEKEIEIPSNISNLQTPEIIVSPSSPQNLICCGQILNFRQADCDGFCDDNMEWDFNVIYINPLDFFWGSQNNGDINVEKNTYSPLIVNVKTRNVPATCGTPSSWSNTISRYYGTVQSGSTAMSEISSFESNLNLDSALPILEYYNLNSKILTCQIIDFYEWAQIKFGNRNLESQEVEKIVKMLHNKTLFDKLKIEIYDINGIKKFKKNIKNFYKHELDLSPLSKGVHFVNFSFGDFSKSKTIIIE